LQFSIEAISLAGSHGKAEGRLPGKAWKIVSQMRFYSRIFIALLSPLSTEEKGQTANKFTKYGSYKKFGLAFHRPLQALCF
jgi:hypothetical protein